MVFTFFLGRHRIGIYIERFAFSSCVGFHSKYHKSCPVKQHSQFSWHGRGTANANAMPSLLIGRPSLDVDDGDDDADAHASLSGTQHSTLLNSEIFE